MSDGRRFAHKALDRAFIFAFFAVLWLPLGVQWSTRDATLAAHEERKLAAFPPMALDTKLIRRFPALFDAYYKDHFGLRDRMIRLNNLLYVGVLKRSPSERVILGKDQWLFLDGRAAGDGDTVSDYRRLNPLTRNHLEKWRWFLQDYHDWLGGRDTRFLLLLIPGKGHVYPDYLPQRFTRVGTETPLDQVVSYLRDRTEIQVLDLRPVLLAARNERQCYMRSDTHWNDFGALRGAREVARAVAEMFPTVEPIDEAAFRSERRRTDNGDLARMVGLPDVFAEEYEALLPIDGWRARTVEQQGTPFPDVESRQPGTAYPSMVVYRDSFTTPLIPFLSEHFRSAVYRWYTDGLDAQLVETHTPELVVLAIGDRRLRREPRHDPRVRAAVAEKRYHAATHTLWRASPKDGFTGIEALPDVELTATDDGLHIRATSRYPHLGLPPLAGTERYLPVVRIDITSPKRTHLELIWSDAGHPGARPQVNAPLKAGRNTVFLAIPDPDRGGELRLDPGTVAGDYVLHAIDVRGIPR